jgi:hypothetical protein
MNQRIVRRGNGPALTCLTRIGPFQVRQMLSQFKQVAGIGHRSCPRFILTHSFLGLAAIAEIRENAPFFERFEALRHRVFNLAGGVLQLIPAAGPVEKGDSEEDSRLSTPILSKRVSASVKMAWPSARA